MVHWIKTIFLLPFMLKEECWLHSFSMLNSICSESFILKLERLLYVSVPDFLLPFPSLCKVDVKNRHGGLPRQSGEPQEIHYSTSGAQQTVMQTQKGFVSLIGFKPETVHLLSKSVNHYTMEPLLNLLQLSL